ALDRSVGAFRELRLAEEPAVALEPATGIARDAQPVGRLVGDDIGDAAAVGLLGDRAAAVPQDHASGLLPRARQDVDLAAREDEARGLRRLALREDQRPLALRQMHGVPAAAEIAGTFIFFRAWTSPLRRRRG